MKKLIDDPRLIYKCCKLYYEDNLGQQDIADHLGISRVSVHRMLKAGKEMGIVVVNVLSLDNLTYTELERELEKCFGLKEAVVVESSPLSTINDQMSMIGSETIKLLGNYIKKGDIVGVSMGRTLHNICANQRIPANSIECTFIPILGGIAIGSRLTEHVHSNQIALNFAKLFGSKHVELFSPAIFSSKEVKEEFMKEESIARVIKHYNKIKTVILGMGIPEQNASTMVKSGYTTVSQLNELKKRGAVGDISLQFYDTNGNTEPFREFNERVAAIPLVELRLINNRIGIASGAEKVETVYGALIGGFVNILVTDQHCAEKLIKFREEVK